jgi:hypothetical protein
VPWGGPLKPNLTALSNDEELMELLKDVFRQTDTQLQQACKSITMSGLPLPSKSETAIPCALALPPDQKYMFAAKIVTFELAEKVGGI